MIPLILSQSDIDTILQLMLEAPVPGKLWLNTFFNLRKQRDDYLAKAIEPPAAAAIVTQPEPAQEG
jgi:hypothetical protein